MLVRQNLLHVVKAWPTIELMRFRWELRAFVVATTLLIGVVTLVGPGARAFADVVPNGCITAASSSGVCPSGSPQISAAAPTLGLGVTATGAVYVASGKELPGVNGLPLSAPIIGMAAPSGPYDYWLAGSDGGVFAFGTLPFFGSMGGHPLNQPIVGIAADGPSGYWLVASDGGIFAFGGAGFYGSMGGKPLNQPIVGMAPSWDGDGYWLVAADGGIFSFGDAQFYGSRGGQPLDAPISAMAPSFVGLGYWLAGADGGIFTYGDAPFNGAEVGQGFPVVGISDAHAPCPPVAGVTCHDQYAVALSNGQLYLNTHP